MKIGTLARQTGTSVDALRFYEERGLLTPAGRTESGYRMYSPEAVSQVKFIKLAQSLGFSLQEVQDILPALVQGDMKLMEVQRLMREKIHTIDAQIERLATLRADVLNTLERLECAPDAPLSTRSLSRPSS